MRIPPILRTPIAAAILSAIFPGLGQLVAGKPWRGLYFAIPTLALAAVAVLLGLVALVNHDFVFGAIVNQSFLTNLLLVDLLAVIYRIWAIVDAYMVARPPRKRFASSQTPAPKSAKATGRLGAVAASLFIVAAILVPQGFVAQADMEWAHALYCATAKIPCWVDANITPDPSVTDVADVETPEIAPSSSTTPMPSYDITKVPTFSTTTDAQSWDADGELNVLLLGLGVQGNASALGPDTIMVLHASMSTGQAELISVGRNNYCTPLPTREIAAHYPNPPYNCPAGTYGPLLFNMPNEILGHCKNWPLPEYASTCGQSGDPNRYLRAYKGFEMTIGNLLGLHVDGSMWINPIGLTALIDALGGVTITVGTRIYDKPCGPAGTRQQKLGASVAVPGNSTCADTAHWGYFVPTGPSGIQRMKDQAAGSGGGLAVYPLAGLNYDVAFVIQPGTYHMDGDWALAYARTRIYDPQADYGRALRQQTLLTSLRKTLDPCRFASLSNVLPLLSVVQAIPYGFNTDMDITNPQNLKAWMNIAKQVLGENVQELVLTPQAVGMPRGVSYVAWDPTTTIPKAQALVKQYFQKALPSTSPGASAGAKSTC